MGNEMTIPNYNDAIDYKLDIIRNKEDKEIFKPSFSVNTQVWMTDNSKHHTYHFYNRGTNDLVVIEEFEESDSEGKFKQIDVTDIPSGYLYPIFWKIAVMEPSIKSL